MISAAKIFFLGIVYACGGSMRNIFIIIKNNKGIFV